MIYLDNGATTWLRPEVREEMLPWLAESYGNPSSPYALGREARRGVEIARRHVAGLLGAKDPKEVFFTSCGTESDNWAIRSAAWALRHRGRHIVTSKAEHHAVLHACSHLEREGFSVTYLDTDEFGSVTPEAVQNAITDETVLISIMWVNNEVGTISPIREISHIAREKGIVLHTDAVQAAGHIPIGVEDVDMLSISAHKLHGPKGVGALYVKSGTPLEVFMEGGAQERKRRAGTENVSGIVGMGKAAELAQAELAEDRRRITLLRDAMIDLLFARIGGVRLNGHPVRRAPGNVNISITGMLAETMLIGLDLAGVACSAGSACTSGSREASHVLTAMGLEPELARGTLRFTLSRYTTEAEIGAAVAELEKIVKNARRK